MRDAVRVLPGSRLVDRAGYARAMAAGMGTVVVGLLLLARLSPTGAYATTLLPGLALWGLGLGVAQVGIVGAATAGAGMAERGVAAGLVNTSAQLGTAVGLALLVGIAAARTEAVAGGEAASAGALVAGYRWALWGGAGLAGVGALVAVLLGTTRSLGTTDR